MKSRAKALFIIYFVAWGVASISSPIHAQEYSGPTSAKYNPDKGYYCFNDDFTLVGNGRDDHKPVCLDPTKFNKIFYSLNKFGEPYCDDQNFTLLLDFNKKPIICEAKEIPVSINPWKTETYSAGSYMKHVCDPKGYTLIVWTGFGKKTELPKSRPRSRCLRLSAFSEIPPSYSDDLGIHCVDQSFTLFHDRCLRSGRILRYFASQVLKTKTCDNDQDLRREMIAYLKNGVRTEKEKESIRETFASLDERKRCEPEEENSSLWTPVIK